MKGPFDPPLSLLRSAPQFLFFTGKGGVGKTSLACACAIALADAGRSVLLVSTDPASNLDEMLGTALSDQPREIANVPGLAALNIDPDAAADAYRARVIDQMPAESTEADRSTVREQLSGACTTEIAAFDESIGLLAGDADDYYRSVKDPKLELRRWMHELAQVRIRYGDRRIHVLLRREGWNHGRSQTYRLYTEERLQLRSKLPKRRKMVVQRNQRTVPKAPDDAWTMDLVADQLADGTKLRALTVVDVFTREALAIEVGQHLKGEDVVRTLDRILRVRSKPKFLFVDNGSEFSGRMLDLWAYRHKVRIDFSRPGKPTDNGHVETFNGSLRDECLNVHWFESLAEARASIEAWRQDYNETRPHMALEYAAPGEFARKSRHLADRPSAIGAED